MKPIFQILIGTNDITSMINDRLLSLRINDEPGIRSDTLELRLDDRDAKLALPSSGTEISVKLGYDGQKLFHKGLFTVDEIDLSGPTQTLTVKAKAANMQQSLKQPKTRPWENVSFGDIITKIAGEHELKPRVSDTLFAINFQHLDQTNESDLHLITRLARQHDVIAKPANGFLLVVPRGEMRSATGKNMSTVSLTKKDLLDWRMTSAERGRYEAVTAYWHDLASASKIPEKVGDGTPVYTLRNTYPNAEEARAASQAKLNSLGRGSSTLSITMPGQSSLCAESKLTLSGVRKGIDGDWVVTRVEHIMNQSGYRCRIEAETPKKGA